MRDQLIEILSVFPEISYIGQVKDAAEAHNSIFETNPDVVILDMRIFDPNLPSLLADDHQLPQSS